MENKLSIKERNEILLQFIDIAEAHKAMYKGCPNDIGITLESLTAAGIDMEVVVWLRKNHYISVKPNAPIWIAWENKYYPDRTIANLKKWLKKYEENK